MARRLRRSLIQASKPSLAWPLMALKVVAGGFPKRSRTSARLKHCQCKTAWLYVDPDEYRPDERRVAGEAWVRIPGKHRNKDAAWGAAMEMLETRH
jgi:hypothetical protein